MRGRLASLCLNYLPKIGSHMWSKQEVALGETKAKCQQSSWLIDNCSIYFELSTCHPCSTRRTPKIMMQLNNMSQPWTSPQHAQTVPCPSQLPSICLGIWGVLSSKELFHLLSSQFAAIVHHQLDLGDWTIAPTAKPSPSSFQNPLCPKAMTDIVLYTTGSYRSRSASTLNIVQIRWSCWKSGRPVWTLRDLVRTEWLPSRPYLKRADKWPRHSWHSREYHPLALRSVHIPNAVRHHPSVSRPSLWQCEATIPRQEPREGLYKYVWECQSMGTLNSDHSLQPSLPFELWPTSDQFTQHVYPSFMSTRTVSSRSGFCSNGTPMRLALAINSGSCLLWSDATESKIPWATTKLGSCCTGMPTADHEASSAIRWKWIYMANHGRMWNWRALGRCQ